MKKNVLFGLIFGVVLGMTAAAHPVFARQEGACKADIKKFCPDVKPGGGSIRNCMMAHEAELSKGCKDNMAEMKQKMEAKRNEIKEACTTDLQLFCANVTPGEGREIACLRANSDKLTISCKEKLPKRMGKGHPPAPPTK